MCRVFDVGETDGAVFLSMELVRGEDLAALLRRLGRLPSDKVIDIAHQLCAGLSAAHAQGVLHRDLKPENVLIDHDGSVRITDFGIAIPRTEAGLHALTGTPAYMAPEQRMPGTAVSEQTDVYALGLVLYELLTGKRAHTQSKGATELPPKPSTLVPNVNAQLERVIMHALAPEPRHRPASVADVAAALPPGTRPLTGPAPIRAGRPFWTASAWRIGVAAALVAAVLVAGSFWWASSAPRTLTAQDTIVLADFENSTGDPVFDGALEIALAVSLEQSPFLKVFPDERARETLRLMQRSPDERVTRTIAREIAQREQLAALLAGSIASLGRNYAIALEAINAETGDVMAREQAEAATKEDVLTALGAATTRLREKLGESLSSVQRFDVPLPRATTPSIDALHAYSLALYEGREVPRLEAIPHLRRAIELDPTFAMAHAQLSAVYANTGQSALAPEFSRKAFELRDRVSDRERFFISWRYYRDAAQAWDKALELSRSWTATYPREAFAFNSLANALIRLGRFDQAVEPLEKAIELDPKFIPAYSNLAAALLALNRPEDARATLQLAADRKLEFIGARRLSYLVAFVQGDTATMKRELDASVGVRETNSAFGWQAHSFAFGGKVREAHEQFRRGIQLALQGQFTEVAAQLTTEDAEVHAIVGQCDLALQEIPPALELSRDNATLERASRIFATCGAAAEAQALTKELATRFPEATLTIRVEAPVTAAAIAMQRGDAARAIDILEPVRSLDHSPSAGFWPAYLRGRAYLQLEDSAAAATEFRSIIDHRGEVPASMLYTLAHLGLARAAALGTDTAAARKAYGDMLTLWAQADTDSGAGEGRAGRICPDKVALADRPRTSPTAAAQGRILRIFTLRCLQGDSDASNDSDCDPACRPPHGSGAACVRPAAAGAKHRQPHRAVVPRAERQPLHGIPGDARRHHHERSHQPRLLALAQGGARHPVQGAGPLRPLHAPRLGPRLGRRGVG